MADVVGGASVEITPDLSRFAAAAARGIVGELNRLSRDVSAAASRIGAQIGEGVTAGISGSGGRAGRAVAAGLATEITSGARGAGSGVETELAAAGARAGRVAGERFAGEFKAQTASSGGTLFLPSTARTSTPAAPVAVDTSAAAAAGEQFANELNARIAKSFQDAYARGKEGAGAAGSSAGRSAGDGFMAEFRARTAGVRDAVAGVLGGAALAGTAAFAATASAGVDYNVLGQRSTAAYTTLLGSRDAAREMMGELSEFARSSPFPRQAFIAGTQQLVGFGMEADKVLPTLDAIQDSVAAVGGDSQMLSEVIHVFAKIEGQGKLTYETLEQLGVRGINAVGIMSEAAGVTSGQMRDRIREGALDADQAIALLTNGMQARFDGAADGVKATWLGATDRIKGATRDIGSALVNPFIGFEGGGVGVEAANVIADVLRVLEKEILPGVVPGMERFADVVEVVVDRIRDGLADGTVVEILREILDVGGMLAPTFAAAGGALSIMVGKQLPLINTMLGGLKAGPVALLAFAAASPQARAAIGDLLADVAPLLLALGEGLVPVLDDLQDILGDLAAGGITVLSVALQAILGVLVALLPIVESVTGFLADQEYVVVALGAAWAMLKIQTAGAAIWGGLAGGVATVKSMTSALGELRAGIQGVAATKGVSNLTAGMGVLKSSLGQNVSAGTAFTGMLAGIAIGATAASYTLDKLAESGKRDASEWLEGLGDADLTTIDSALERVVDINDRIQELNELKNSGSTNYFDDEHIEAEIEALSDAHKTLAPQVLAGVKALGAWRDETGLSVEQVEQLIKATGLDLTTAFDSAGRPARQLQDELDKVTDAADLTGQSIKNIEFTPDQIAKMQADAEAVKAIIGSVQGWAEREFSILNVKDESVDPKTRLAAVQAVRDAEADLAEFRIDSPEAIMDAEDRLRKARRNGLDDLRDAENRVHRIRLEQSQRVLSADAVREEIRARENGTTRLSEAEEKLRDLQERRADSIGEAETALARQRRDQARSAEDAEAKVAEARAKLRELDESHDPLDREKIRRFFEESLADGQKFSNNLNEAFAKGYDPALIGELAAAGPEQAGPILEQLVETTSAAYVESINKAYKAIDDFTVHAVRQAQLMQMAINDGSAFMAEQLQNAVRLDAIVRADPTVSMTDLQKRLGLDPETIRKIAAEFDLNLNQVQGRTTSLGVGDKRIADALAATSSTEYVPQVYSQDVMDQLRALDASFGDYISSDPTAVAILDITDPEERAAELEKLIADYAENDPKATAVLETLQPQVALNWLDGQLKRLTSEKWNVKIDVELDAIGRWLADNPMEDWQQQRLRDWGTYGKHYGGGARWGAVHEYASGGIHAMVGKGDLIRWAEPETEMEAYVPKRGDTTRSVAILNEAASWFDMAVVPKKLRMTQMFAGGIIPHGAASRVVPMATGGVTGMDVAMIREAAIGGGYTGASFPSQTAAGGAPVVNIEKVEFHGRTAGDNESLARLTRRLRSEAHLQDWGSVRG